VKYQIIQKDKVKLSDKYRDAIKDYCNSVSVEYKKASLNRMNEIAKMLDFLVQNDNYKMNISNEYQQALYNYLTSDNESKYSLEGQLDKVYIKMGSGDKTIEEWEIIKEEWKSAEEKKDLESGEKPTFLKLFFGAAIILYLFYLVFNS
jgi:hypothetical protein